MQNNHLSIWSKFAFKKGSFHHPRTVSSPSRGERGRGEGGCLEWHQYKLSEELRNDLDELSCEENKREGLILKYLGSNSLIQELLSFYLFNGRVFGLGFRQFGISLRFAISTLSIPVPVYCFAKQLFKGLAFLHSMGCFHADINCENVLIRPLFNGNILLQIVDFGRSCIDRLKHWDRYSESVESLSSSCGIDFDVTPWLKQTEGLSPNHPLWKRDKFMYNVPFRPPDLLIADLFLLIQNHTEMQHFSTPVGYFCDVYACAMLVIQVMKPHFIEHHQCLDTNCNTLCTAGKNVDIAAIETKMEEYIEKTVITLKQNPFFKTEHLTNILMRLVRRGASIPSRSIEVNRTISSQVMASLPKKFATVFPIFATSTKTFLHYHENLFRILEGALDPNLGNRKSSLQIDSELDRVCTNIVPITKAPHNGKYSVIATNGSYSFYDDHLLVATSWPRSLIEEFHIDVYYVLNVSFKVLQETLSLVYSPAQYTLTFHLQNGEYIS